MDDVFKTLRFDTALNLYHYVKNFDIEDDAKFQYVIKHINEFGITIDVFTSHLKNSHPKVPQSTIIAWYQGNTLPDIAMRRILRAAILGYLEEHCPRIL